MSMHLGENRNRACYDTREKPKWSALDDRSKHAMVCDTDDDITQEGTQENKEVQVSEDFMLIRDSCDVNVTTTDVQAAINLQAALQAAIVLVVRISLAGSDDAEEVTQELMQTSKIKQRTSQKTIIENSRDVNVTATDVQAAINIQLLLQILIALVITLDIL
ncbi:spore coat protein [Natribacillus halophilus]|uniref:Spore coat protein X n=1 Tax=Natribacillus halophilus TaxID=549003 RepID=A0A1G8JL92_9BACI|nr:spore coat protein [Natribacillus halophilus]SDI31965.1 spore coat protein X [Natribacillus halophilus]